jgi:septum formation topological specificity factor MinE
MALFEHSFCSHDDSKYLTEVSKDIISGISKYIISDMETYHL